LVTLVILVWRTELKHQLFRRGHSLPKLQQILEVFKAGAPLSFQQFCECAAFVTTAILIGNIGTDDLAARQVANTIVNTTFLVPLGFSYAAMILVGKQIAENHVSAALNLGRAALFSTVLIMAVFGIGIFYLRSQIPEYYGLNANASHLATSMLITAAIFQIADGLQVVTAGILRGLGDIKVPAYLIILAWWGVAIPMEWLLGFYYRGGSLGVWTGLACGVGCCALLLGLRLNWVSRNLKRNQGA
jgi:MATE family multidrug resistance protein